MIAAGESFVYGLPLWYTKTGNVLGWILFAVTWLVTLAGGWAGLFLGWIPALVIYKLAKSVWLPVVTLLAWAALTKM